MAKAESTMRSNSVEGLNIDFMRSLVKQYSELGLWTSALFWADAAAATGSAINGSASGDDVWLLASAMLAQGELHRAAYAITSRGLHKRHLLCLGVAMRAYLSAKEPETALTLIEECDPALLEPRSTDQTHNRALASVLVWQTQALGLVERREASLACVRAALRADPACLDATALLYLHHKRPHAQEAELVESLAINSQLDPAEAMLLRAAYNDRLDRPPPPQPDCPLSQEVEIARQRMSEAGVCRAHRLAAACEWHAAIKELDAIDPWVAPELRVACLVELKKSSELFAFAHTLVDAYPNNWTSWFAVGCYYYLIGKNEFARRYLSKAKSLDGSAGCVWLAYGHSFAADNEHDQAMAAYFKASQLMSGSHLPPLYVGVECSLLNNVSMCEKFLTRAAILHSSQESDVEEECEKSVGWSVVLAVVTEPHVAHEAGAAAYSAADYCAAHTLWLRALHAARGEDGRLGARWAATLDALGHAARRLGRAGEALGWHEQALALRPRRASTQAARALCLALLARDADAALALHAALHAAPDDAVALALLDAVLYRLDATFSEEEIPTFPFPQVSLSLPAASPSPGPGTPAPPATPRADATNTSDMSMSFD